jgi:Uma2 family endonuclease
VVPATKLTYADYAAIDDGRRYELIDGELILYPARTPGHQSIVGNILFAFDRHLRGDCGGVLMAPLDVVVSDHTVLQPDVIVIKEERAAIVGPANLAGPPNLIVEIVSDDTRDRDEIIKPPIYAHFGVDEYWIADPENELVRAYRRSTGGYVPAFGINTETGGTITTPLLPKFALDIADVFRVWTAGPPRE